MKKNILLLIVLSVLFSLLQSCNQKESVNLKEVAERFSQAYNQHDVDAIGEFYAQDATYYVSGEPEPVRGRKAIKENCQAFFRAFPDLKTEFINIFTSEGHFIAEGISRGTHSGPMATPEGDVPPTGLKVELKFVFIAKFNPAGLIIEDRTYFDSAVMMSQLGLN